MPRYLDDEDSVDSTEDSDRKGRTQKLIQLGKRRLSTVPAPAKSGCIHEFRRTQSASAQRTSSRQERSPNSGRGKEQGLVREIGEQRPCSAESHSASDGPVPARTAIQAHDQVQRLKVGTQRVGQPLPTMAAALPGTLSMAMALSGCTPSPARSPTPQHDAFMTFELGPSPSARNNAKPKSPPGRKLSRPSITLAYSPKAPRSRSATPTVMARHVGSIRSGGGEREAGLASVIVEAGLLMAKSLTPRSTQQRAPLPESPLSQLMELRADAEVRNLMSNGTRPCLHSPPQHASRMSSRSPLRRSPPSKATSPVFLPDDRVVYVPPFIEALGHDGRGLSPEISVEHDLLHHQSHDIAEHSDEEILLCATCQKRPVVAADMLCNACHAEREGRAIHAPLQLVSLDAQLRVGACVEHKKRGLGVVVQVIPDDQRRKPYRYSAAPFTP